MVCYRMFLWLHVVAHTFGPSAQELKAGLKWVQDQTGIHSKSQGLHSETLSKEEKEGQKVKEKKKKLFS